jgi:hypothetical protein
VITPSPYGRFFSIPKSCAVPRELVELLKEPSSSSSSIRSRAVSLPLRVLLLHRRADPACTASG